MRRQASDVPLDATGAAAPPRRNGELVFASPWESRLFGLTLSLHRAGLFEWEEFRRRLIEEIGTWDATAGADSVWSYYAHWQAALERLLADKRICTPQELAARSAALAARPSGHDHRA
jgi:nitrile hydratase accessory protein